MANTKIVFDDCGTGKTPLEVFSQVRDKRVSMNGGADDKLETDDGAANGPRWFEEAAERVKLNDELDKKRMRERLREKRLKKKLKTKRRRGEDDDENGLGGIAVTIGGGSDDDDPHLDGEGSVSDGDDDGGLLGTSVAEMPTSLTAQEDIALRLLDG